MGFDVDTLPAFQPGSFWYTPGTDDWYIQPKPHDTEPPRHVPPVAPAAEPPGPDFRDLVRELVRHLPACNVHSCGKPATHVYEHLKLCHVHAVEMHTAVSFRVKALPWGPALTRVLDVLGDDDDCDWMEAG